MWATLALAASLQLAPAQQNTLALKNPRPTYGMFGQVRKDTKVLTGDLFMLAYDIEGLQVKEDGQILYSIGMELTSKEGKAVFRQEPRDLQATNSLGGGTKPAFAYLEIGTDTPPGEYTIKLTVTDRTAKQTQSLSYKFEVVSGQLGFVQNSITLPGLHPTPPLAVPGQEFWVNFALVGFALEETKKQPNVTVEMQVIDLETNKPTLAKPFTGGAKEVTEEFKKILPMQFVLQLNRPGRFRIQLKATDQVSKQTATQELDFTVAPMPGAGS